MTSLGSQLSFRIVYVFMTGQEGAASIRLYDDTEQIISMESRIFPIPFEIPGAERVNLLLRIVVSSCYTCGQIIYFCIAWKNLA